MHDPGGKTTTSDSKPPSVWLEGESGKQSSQHVEPNVIETGDDRPKGYQDDRKPLNNPVGMMDGDECPPNTPTELPNEDEEKSGQGDKARGREDERDELREVEAGDQSKGNGCQQDGRMSGTDSPTSSANHDLTRVGTGVLAKDKASQQQDGKLNVLKNVPALSTPLPYTMTQPTHHVNLPCRQGRLKTLSTNVSKPEHTV
ncbi:hypothetical protein PAXINDRAFT_19280 [Paxillus involutus ATCC 200175]|uniref:Uncharacterized protein n=1 Tax=Paxillus involutus ATCC 200175 TaxID=664439 RepID=A0A0C9T8R3_PAXIN|nr:hypothetical protein PAXINDRAFT_19280 [Paxillus involutus ATCC 200175]